MKHNCAINNEQCSMAWAKPGLSSGWGGWIKIHLFNHHILGLKSLALRRAMSLRRLRSSSSKRLNTLLLLISFIDLRAASHTWASLHAQDSYEHKIIYTDNVKKTDACSFLYECIQATLLASEHSVSCSLRSRRFAASFGLAFRTLRWSRCCCSCLIAFCTRTSSCQLVKASFASACKESHSN